MRNQTVSFKDKLFFVVQGFLKYSAFNFSVKLRYYCYKPFFKKMGKNVRIFDGVTIKYPSDIVLEDNVTINHMCFIAALGGLTIKKNTMVGNNSILVTSTHNTELMNMDMVSQGISCSPIIIAEDVWLGAGVKIFYGTRIEKNSIVGAGSVIVNKTFPQYSVIAGVPGRIIKMRTAPGRN